MKFKPGDLVKVKFSKTVIERQPDFCNNFYIVVGEYAQDISNSYKLFICDNYSFRFCWDVGSSLELIASSL